MRPFTHCINVRNVNEAMERSLRYMPHNARLEQSRNGPVLVSETPVITCFSSPAERVLFSPMRDANPFFHLFEALWMLAGRDDVAFPVLFNNTFGQFSDDGERFWGAYGFRWRRWFGYDQLEAIIAELRSNPESRRCVLSMWSPGYIVFPNSEDTLGMVQPDLHQALGGGKDVPCNTNVFFRIIDGQLDMMVNCRSNDLFWGAYGANVVHMSMLLEYVAAAVGVKIGRYYQNSFNFHAYVEKFPIERFKDYANDARDNDLYQQGNAEPLPLMIGPRSDFDYQLFNFLEWAGGDEEHVRSCAWPHFDEPFILEVAVPARMAWHNHKKRDYVDADMWCNRIAATDWRAACKAWIERRWRRYARKEQGNG